MLMYVILLVTDLLRNAIYLSFSRLYQGNETRNGLDLILDSRFKNVDGRISHLEDMISGLLDKVEGKINYYYNTIASFRYSFLIVYSDFRICVIFIHFRMPVALTYKQTIERL